MNKNRSKSVEPVTIERTARVDVCERRNSGDETSGKTMAARSAVPGRMPSCKHPMIAN